ncbi:MAG: hypothetical protein RLZZ200_880 [Pseudomonadota bacterium]|jgi:flagellar FliL protein
MSNAPAPAEAEAPKPGKKKLIILIAAAVVLIGGGATAFLMMRGGDKKEGEAHAEKVEPRKPSQYVALDPPFVVNFESGHAKFLQVAVQLMTREPEFVEFLKSHDPAIRNDLLLLLGAQQVEELSNREGKEHLRQEALETVRKLIETEGEKGEKLENLYFTSFVMQ